MQATPSGQQGYSACTTQKTAGVWYGSHLMEQKKGAGITCRPAGLYSKVQPGWTAYTLAGMGCTACWTPQACTGTPGQDICCPASGPSEQPPGCWAALGGVSSMHMEATHCSQLIQASKATQVSHSTNPIDGQTHVDKHHAPSCQGEGIHQQPPWGEVGDKRPDVAQLPHRLAHSKQERCRGD